MKTKTTVTLFRAYVILIILLFTFLCKSHAQDVNVISQRQACETLNGFWISNPNGESFVNAFVDSLTIPVPLNQAIWTVNSLAPTAKQQSDIYFIECRLGWHPGNVFYDLKYRFQGGQMSFTRTNGFAYGCIYYYVAK